MHAEPACPVNSLIRHENLRVGATYRNSRPRLESDWVDGIICADDEGKISVLEVIIDFIHFQHD